MLIAIDFGTYHSSAALIANGNLTLVKEPISHGYSYPSSIYLTDAGEILVGQAAENNRLRDIKRYRREFKRILGCEDPHSLGDLALTGEALVTAVLQKLKHDGERTIESYHQGEITDAVITVPATYREYKRKLMESAGIAAGFSSVRLVDEPVAAAIYYTDRHQDILTPGETILVYDLGGGTFDATLIRQAGTNFQILAQPLGLERCGGTDFDRAIYRYVQECCSDALREKLSRKQEWQARAIVGDACIRAKHQLSFADETTIDIPVEIDRVESYPLTRQELATRIAPFIDDTVEVCDRAISGAGMSWQDVDRVLMVGGSCRMPSVRQTIASRLGHPPLLVDEPELAVCLGGAIYTRSESPATDDPPSSASASTTTVLDRGSFRQIHRPPDPFEVFAADLAPVHRAATDLPDNWF